MEKGVYVYINLSDLRARKSSQVYAVYSNNDVSKYMIDD